MRPLSRSHSLRSGTDGSGQKLIVTLFYPRESRGTMGNRALSHDSIFFPESGQDPARPVRVFSQENVCDRIKALQVSICLARSLGCLSSVNPEVSKGFPLNNSIQLKVELLGLPSSPGTGK